MGTPGSRKRRAEIEDVLLTNIVHESAWQKQPNTMIELIACYAGEQYSEFAFTKACWPDDWDPDIGIDRARSKAIADIAKRITEEQNA